MSFAVRSTAAARWCYANIKWYRKLINHGRDLSFSNCERFVWRRRNARGERARFEGFTARSLCTICIIMRRGRVAICVGMLASMSLRESGIGEWVFVWMHAVCVSMLTYGNGCLKCTCAVCWLSHRMLFLYQVTAQPKPRSGQTLAYTWISLICTLFRRPAPTRLETDVRISDFFMTHCKSPK